MIDKPYNPVSLFGYLCSLQKATPNFLSFEGLPEFSSPVQVILVLEKMGYSLDNNFLTAINDQTPEEINLFVSNALKLKKLETEIFTFLKQVGVDRDSYKNLSDLQLSLQNVRKDQADERLYSVKSKVNSILGISDSDIIIPFLISYFFQRYYFSSLN